MSGLNEQSGDRFMTLASSFNLVAQGKIIISQIRFESVIAIEAQYFEEMAHFSRAEQATSQH